jgi:ABC transporter substrate binding protein (PQQ-dependent alcohol dehydrogenase system)
MIRWLAFKGQRLTLRDWNLQLRQPILLVDGRMVVSVSPQEGFLHQVSELDTLGIDRPETKCRLHLKRSDRGCGVVICFPK